MGTLSERIAPLAVGSGLLSVVLILVAILFATDFPSTGRIKAMAAYRVLAGAYFVAGAALGLFFCGCFAIIIMNLS